MNAPLNPKTVADPIANAREEAYHNLHATRHYLLCALQHLEIADDPGTLYDIQHAKEYFRAALRHLEIPRAAMRQRLMSEGAPDA